jgi:hypothetical protein
MNEQLPPAAAIVFHEVESFEAWKPKFDQHGGARKRAGILGHHINRGADDPNLLAVYMPARSREQLETFLADDDLRVVMKDAGVKGTPSIKIMRPMSIDLDMTRARAGLIVIHEVADYDRWRAVYDEVDPLRLDAGITGHAVNQLADDPKTVIIYHQSDSVDALQRFIESPKLKATMERAGVTSKPEATFWNALPSTSY